MNTIRTLLLSSLALNASCVATEDYRKDQQQAAESRVASDAALLERIAQEKAAAILAAETRFKELDEARLQAHGSALTKQTASAIRKSSDTLAKSILAQNRRIDKAISNARANAEHDLHERIRLKVHLDAQDKAVQAHVNAFTGTIVDLKARDKQDDEHHGETDKTLAVLTSQAGNDRIATANLRTYAENLSSTVVKLSDKISGLSLTANRANDNAENAKEAADGKTGTAETAVISSLVLILSVLGLMAKDWLVARHKKAKAKPSGD